MRQFNPNVLHSVKGTTADTKDKDKFKNLIGATDPKLDREVREKLITARVGLLLKASFFGNLATRLKLVNADVLPCIPSKGSVGASGDLAPLANMSCVLIGVAEARAGGETLSVIVHCNDITRQEEAERLKKDYWLYVVFNCGTKPEVHAIQDPVRLGWEPIVRVEHYHVAAQKILVDSEEAQA